MRTLVSVTVLPVPMLASIRGHLHLSSSRLEEPLCQKQAPAMRNRTSTQQRVWSLGLLGNVDRSRWMAGVSCERVRGGDKTKRTRGRTEETMTNAYNGATALTLNMTAASLSGVIQSKDEVRLDQSWLERRTPPHLRKPLDTPLAG